MPSPSPPQKTNKQTTTTTTVKKGSGFLEQSSQETLNLGILELLLLKSYGNYVTKLV